MNYRPWKPEENEELKQLYAAGQQVKVIARKMNRTPSSINTRIRRLGFERVRYHTAYPDNVHRMTLTMPPEVYDLLRSESKLRRVSMNALLNTVICDSLTKTLSEDKKAA